METVDEYSRPAAGLSHARLHTYSTRRCLQPGAAATGRLPAAGTSELCNQFRHYGERERSAAPVAQPQGVPRAVRAAPEDLEELVDLRVPREQGPLVHHLNKYAADRPHVDRSGVVLGSCRDASNNRGFCQATACKRLTRLRASEPRVKMFPPSQPMQRCGQLGTLLA